MYTIYQNITLDMIDCSYWSVQ